MATEKTIILITGGEFSSNFTIIVSQDTHLTVSSTGNAGIGFELASQLLSDSSRHVLLGSRSAEKGEAAVKDLQSRKQPGTVELVQLDVTSDDSVSAAAKTVESNYGRYARCELCHTGNSLKFSVSYTIC
jgi:NAD(P)-dependent dehydrogenase (short-subunit alcohol dehydrogenase family)